MCAQFRPVFMWSPYKICKEKMYYTIFCIRSIILDLFLTYWDLCGHSSVRGIAYLQSQLHIWSISLNFTQVDFLFEIFNVLVNTFFILYSACRIKLVGNYTWHFKQLGLEFREIDSIDIFQGVCRDFEFLAFWSVL